jgi:type IV pilus assembly protein PilC
MIFSTQLPLASLIELCRSMRHYLSAGLSLLDVFRMLATRGSAPLRPVAQNILERLEQGDDLKSALKAEENRFPPLLLGLAQVGEQSGNLPEVFGELEKYLQLQRKLRRKFWGQAAWPLMQLGAAILVIAGLIFIMGLLPVSEKTGKAPDPLGIGLSGGSGAMIFLTVVLLLLATLGGVYLVLTRLLHKKPVVDRLLLQVPILGPCLEALVLARFCLAMRLTMDSSLSITRALRLSLQATDNAAYQIQSEAIVHSLKAGDTISDTLQRSGLFPWEFQQILVVGEESGLLPESLGRQAHHYQELAEHRLVLLSQAASWGVWLFVALLIGFAIFRIFSGFIMPLYEG